MRFSGRRQSGNVEDRRGVSAGGLAAGGGIGGVILLVLYLVMGGNPQVAMNQLGQGQRSGAYVATPEEKVSEELVRVTLADTEEVWGELFKKSGKTYVPPKLVLFSGQVNSACGTASSAVGPFYCGEDRSVYIDLAFFSELRTRFGAGGDFAQAYVLAHEVGHHVQNLMGTMSAVNDRRQSGSERQANALSVRLELQADFYAGVWAHHAQSMAQIDQEDIREALAAATAIGDDRLQMQSQGRVVPDSFTHGTSEQRTRWFGRGFQSGDLKQGDTFRTNNL